MSRISGGDSADGGFLCGERRRATRCRAARRVSTGLRLAAAPVFSVMALLAGLAGHGNPADVLCLTADHASPVGGMVPMYLLMSVFHLPPWLTLLFGQGNGAGAA